MYGQGNKNSTNSIGSYESLEYHIYVPAQLK